MKQAKRHVPDRLAFDREMAVGNTFGATALSSYGGFWIAYGILLTPHWNILGKGGPYNTPATLAVDPLMGESAVGIFLTGWLIFTTILLLCTLRSTVMFFMLFFTLDLAFLMLACGAFAVDNGAAEAAHKLTQAGGGFGMLAAFLAWYNAFAGIADSRYGFAPLLPSPVSSLFPIPFTPVMVNQVYWMEVEMFTPLPHRHPQAFPRFMTPVLFPLNGVDAFSPHLWMRRCICQDKRSARHLRHTT